MYNAFMTIRIPTVLVLIALFASCSIRTQPSGATATTATPAPQTPTVEDLPFATATPDTWEAGLRDVFTALRSANLETFERVQTISPDGTSRTVKLNLTPLERERIQMIVAERGQLTARGFYTQTWLLSSFTRVEKVSEAKDSVTVYFRYRRPDVVQAKYVFGLASRLGNLSKAMQDLQSITMTKEAQWTFVKVGERYVPVTEEGPSPNEKLVSFRNFLIELKVDLQFAIKEF
jgi:hypothetical protein